MPRASGDGRAGSAIASLRFRRIFIRYRRLYSHHSILLKYNLSAIRSLQPLLPTYPPTDRLHEHSHSQPDMILQIDSPLERVREDIWDVIRSRCKTNAIDLQYHNNEFHPFIAQNMETPLTTELAWKLLHRPLHISTSELKHFLRLRQSTSETPAQLDVWKVYYVRTFAIKASQLQAMIEAWEAG